MTWKDLNTLKTIRVTNLSYDVDETTLIQHFSQIGTVEECLIRRSQNKGLYAFIIYQKSHHAKEAILNLNSTIIFGFPCQIFSCEKGINIRDSISANVFIANLKDSFDENDLYFFMKKFGKIIDIKISNRKRLAYFCFQDEDIAREVVEKFPEFTQFGENLIAKYIGNYTPRENSIIIENLDPNTQLKEVVELLLIFGEMKECSFENKPYEHEWISAMAVFESNWAASKAIEMLEGSFFKRDQLRVRWIQEVPFSTERFIRKVNDTLYIRNIPQEFSQNKINEIFSQFGHIKRCCLIYGPNNRSRGFCYVTFKDEKDAEDALESMDGSFLGDSCLNVKFDRKENFRYMRNEAKKRDTTLKKENPDHYTNYDESDENLNQEKENRDIFIAPEADEFLMKSQDNPSSPISIIYDSQVTIFSEQCEKNATDKKSLISILHQVEAILEKISELISNST